MTRQAHDRTAPRKSTATPSRPAEPRPSLARVFPTVLEWTNPRGPFLVPLLLLLTARILLMLNTPTSAEDAFITFRYARNLAAGQGLVYNPGEYVMGFTSPLWTVWSALGIKLTGNPVPWALAWSFLADLVTLLAGGMLMITTAGIASAWAFTFFFALWPYFSALSISGMEMSVCLGLLVLGAALTQRRSRASGLVLAALALARPETFVAAALLSLAASWRDRLVALAITAAGVVALTLTYGSPIPNSMLVKANVYGTPGPWSGRHWWDWISPIIMGRWPGNGDPVMLAFLAVVLAPATIAGGRELWRQRDSALARLALALTVIWLGYIVVGAAYFWWYFAFPLTAAALLTAVGLPRVTRGIGIPVALVLFVASSWTIATELYRGRSYNEATAFGNMAEALRSRCKPGDRVMLEPIGMIGFTCPVVVIDETGLVSPEVAKRRLEGPGWYTDIVASRQPQWLVVRRGVIESQNAFAGVGRPFRNQGERDALLARYHTVTTTGDPASENALLLLQRQP